MRSSRRARLATTLALAVVVTACGGGEPPGQQRADEPPPVCPLTGVKPARGTVPDRPALAVKVENLPEVRPQTGLSFADIIYEEPVEGGITRFIVIYQCRDATRIQPIRSARISDVDVLAQYGRPLFAFAGGVKAVFDRVDRSELVNINYNVPEAADAYHRDPNEAAPHNLYSSTTELYGAAKDEKGAPNPIFKYSEQPPTTGRQVGTLHIPFSSFSDVYWRWDQPRNAYLRSHGDEPHTYSDGNQVAATNVVVQVVKVVLSNIVDAAGNRSPEVVSTGSGRAYILRGGRMTVGTWRRPTVDDVTKFYNRNGDEVSLLPGVTWVELVPSDVDISASR
ncbi:MAG: DUF3048 domain-containing protein [Actinomycetota bacterium]|nr:DUF3048 domain-containing protein [Actinomycetota bacterium]